MQANYTWLTYDCGMRLATVVSTSKFDADAEKLLTEDERIALDFSLAKDPEARPVLPGLNGVRAGIVLLITIHAKNEERI